MRFHHSGFKSALYILALLFFFDVATFAQDSSVIRRTHSIAVSNPQSVQPAVGNLNIVAVMVEFQPDSNRFTSGTGIFGEGGLPFLESRPNFSVDPLPHDRQYFEAHLEFAKNYFQKSSGGALQLNYRVDPRVFRLDKEMAEYSPTGETFTLEKIGNFLSDVWAKIEENGGIDVTGLDPDNTAFIIFHAGIGRDIELTGTTLERTPQDIPSLSFRENDLKTLFDNPNFEGFPINSGTFLVKNSLILPRTQSRIGFDIQDNEFIVPISINGLLCASVGSYLGLPDLFNTETGVSGIGRFGLMDGAGFFSYNGLFPPEPSAWEKIFLGWENPFQVEPQTAQTIQLPAVSLHQPNSIAKIEITTDEFFLIENRHRDLTGNGVLLTIRQPDGNIVEQRFTNLDEAFTFQETGFDTLLIPGVIIDLDNFDWSLPGGLDRGDDNLVGTGDDRFLNGGMLIWHIDEAIIRSLQSQNRINNNPFRRGIDLEEADGAQDIGQPISTLFSNNEDFGTAFDFWWSGNNSRVITPTGTVILFPGEFSPTSQPSNSSNSGATSFFRMFDFSDNTPTASFSVEAFVPEESAITPVAKTELNSSIYFTSNDAYWDSFPLSLSVFETPTDTFLVIPSQTGVQVLPFEDFEAATTLFNRPPQQTLSVNGQLIIAENPANPGDDIIVESFSWNSATSSFDLNWSSTLPDNSGFISSLGGDTLFADFTDRGILLSTGAPLFTSNKKQQISARQNGVQASASSQIVEFSGLDIPEFVPQSSQNRLFTGLIKTNNLPLFYVFDDEQFTFVNTISDERQQHFFPISREQNARWPAIDDSLLFFRTLQTDGSLIGNTFLGAVVDNTPITPPKGSKFVGTPLIADLSPLQDNSEFLVMSYDSVSINIHALDRFGRRLSGFPLFVGSLVNPDAEPIHPIIYKDKLIALSHNGTLQIWKLEDVRSSTWPAKYGKDTGNKVSGDISIPPQRDEDFGVLNKKETYNWPNPAADETNIRFELQPPGGQVEVTIITPSGKKLLERTMNSFGGAPEEFLLDTRGWESGVYYARLKATVNGRSDSKLIKIVILR